MTQSRKFIQLKTELPGPRSRELIARREASMPASYGKTQAEQQAKYSIISNVRGLGAMLAIEFVEDRKTKQSLEPEKTVAIVQDVAPNGVLSIPCGLYSNGLRFLFPLVISEEQLHEGLNVVEEAIAKAL